MTASEAKKIVGTNGEKFDHISVRDYVAACAFLEAWAVAEKLAEALEKINKKIVEPNKGWGFEFFQLERIVSKALALYDQFKGKK